MKTDKHVREVSKSNLLGHHQDSSLFRNMVQTQEQKYTQRAKEETMVQSQDKQQQIRIKYGSK